MTYRSTNGDERWKIDALKFDPLSRWRLYHAVNQAWRRLQIFSTAEAAMAAVAKGNTGVPTWDAVPHNPADFTDEKWSFERW
jgi:hypothetical protein